MTTALAACAGVASAQEVTQGDYGAFIETPQGPEFRLDFVMNRMRNNQPISQASVNALRAIALGGTADYGDMVDSEKAAELALLLEEYGLDSIARQMRLSFGVSTGGVNLTSPGGAHGASNIQGWSSGASGIHSNPAGASIRDEGDYIVVQDPPGGLVLRNMTMNCLYRSVEPVHAQRPTGQYVQELTPPSPIMAKRLVQRMGNGEKIEETYEVQRIVFDSRPGTVTEDRFNAFFFGRKVLRQYQERYNPVGSNSSFDYRVAQERVQEAPAWHKITCSTIHARP